MRYAYNSNSKLMCQGMYHEVTPSKIMNNTLGVAVVIKS